MVPRGRGCAIVNYSSVQRHIDYGRGKASAKLGQPYLAYRIGPSAAGDFPTAWTVIPSHGLSPFPMFVRRMPDTKIPLALPRAAIINEIVNDMTDFLLGDIFVQADPAYVPGVSYGAGATSLPGTQQFTAMCLALHQPVGKSVGIRLDRCASIYRPAGTPLTFEDASKYWASTHDNDTPLVLTGGQYVLNTANAGQVGSLVPIGLVADHRGGEKVFGPGVPGMVAPIRFFVYIPPLPGYSAREGDALITEDGARYVMRSPYIQEAGVVGTQTLCDRKIAQATL